jgi:hypothetical protein
MPKKKLSLFEQELKQRIANSSKKIRDVVHWRLFRLLWTDHEDSDAESDLQYRSKVEEMIDRNKDLQKEFEKIPAPILGASIIFFLAELEYGKVVRIPWLTFPNNFRTYKKEPKKIKGKKKREDPLFDEVRGKPIDFFITLIRKAANETDLSEYSDLIAHLLLKNAGYGDGTMEKLYLNLLWNMGRKSDILMLQKYEKKVSEGIFGCPDSEQIGFVGRFVDRDERQKEIITRIRAVIKKLGEKT